MNGVSAEFNPSITQSNYLIRNRLLRSIRLLAPKLKGKLLDFGCGQKPYKSLFEVGSYIGIDFENPGHIHENEAIDVFYNGLNIPFGNAYFDSIFTSEVFEHVFNLPDILKELNRVLKMGGLMLVTCPFSFCEHETPNDFARYTSFGLTSLLTRNGFEVLQYIKTGNSIEALAQLQLVYIHQHISPWLKKIPLVRSAFKTGTYTFLNLAALVCSRLLPAGKDLYMSNVVLCRKINTVTV